MATIKEQTIALADTNAELTAASVASALGVDRKEAANALASLTREGLLVRVSRGIYAANTVTEPKVAEVIEVPEETGGIPQIENMRRAAWIAALFDLNTYDLVQALEFLDKHNSRLDIPA